MLTVQHEFHTFNCCGYNRLTSLTACRDGSRALAAINASGESAVSIVPRQDICNRRAFLTAATSTSVHRLFYRVCVLLMCIIKINLCIIKCQIVYL